MSTKDAPTMQDAIIAADCVVIATQRALLVSAHKALDAMLSRRPILGAINYGTGTVGNLLCEIQRELDHPGDDCVDSIAKLVEWFGEDRARDYVRLHAQRRSHE